MQNSMFPKSTGYIQKNNPNPVTSCGRRRSPATKKSNEPRKTTKSAAEAVKSSKVKEITTDANANKKVWKGSDIARLKPWEFEKVEAEIDLARQEGRIDMNS